MIFSWTTGWDGIVMMEKTMFPNSWEMTIEFDSMVDDPYQEFVSIGRCQHLIEERFQDSIFANVEDEFVSKMHEDLKCSVITLPEDPLEVSIAVAALSKMICITDGRFDFAGVKISSRLSEGLECTFDATDLAAFEWLTDNPIRKLTGEPAWFMRKDAGCTDIIVKKKKKLEVIRDVDQWENYNLGWEPTANPLPSAEIIPAPKHAPLRGWKPKVIDGGKSA